MDYSQAIGQGLDLMSQAVGLCQYTAVISSLTLGLLLAFCVMFFFKK